jgi:hypothetical protein
MALDTVADYIAKARTLLQDVVEPYRYGDADLVESLNEGILESRRLRPDMWIGMPRGASLPSYSSTAQSTAVAIDPQFRMAFVYWITGQAQLTDQEDNQDQRALAFIGKFNTALTGGSTA